jgi:hypothetical protein
VAEKQKFSKGGGRRQRMISEPHIHSILAKQGISLEHVTFTIFERALREYRESHPDAVFDRWLWTLLAYGDFALGNRAVLHEAWNEAKARVGNPQQWQDLATEFQQLSAEEEEALRSGQIKERLRIFGNHLNCTWSSSREGDIVSLKFDVVAAKAGRQLRSSPEIAQAVRQKAQWWADFWKYCLWFHLGELDNGTIEEPLKSSVKLCLGLALHCINYIAEEPRAGVGLEGGQPQKDRSERSPGAMLPDDGADAGFQQPPVAPPSGKSKASSESISVTGDQRPTRKGEVSLLRDLHGSLNESVSFDRARSYLGVSRRQIQRLVSEKKALTVVGGGSNRQITVSSLLAYLPERKAT